MKHLLILCGLLAGLSFGVQAQKLGHVDTQVLLGILVNNSDFESKYQAKQLEWQSLVTEMEANLQTLQTELEDPNSNLPDVIRQNKERDFQTQVQNYQSLLQSSDQDLQSYQMELLQPLETQLIEAVNSVGEEHGYTYIFTAGAIIYSGGDDITDLVKTKLGL
tara:strand:+ start:332 stop:820 length:489 start_codon:yes stop_codon:yes gene_type:complete